jgi:hypothetical protein
VSKSAIPDLTSVTRGRRYMFLPFLYDYAAARLRAENEKYLDLDGAPQDAPAGAQDPER